MRTCRLTFVAVCPLLVAMSARLLFAQLPTDGHPEARPNIVYILCDDLGYGDVQAYNTTRGKIATPNIDRLASEGMRFTDVHSGSSVCTPTRYGILTGRYAWRTRLQSGVLQGMSPPLIDANRMTVATLLKQHGYTTAIIGKWHLGLRFGRDRWSDHIQDGPLQHGFDYFFGISASLDMPPFVYLENDRLTKVPTVEKKWGRSGPAAEDFEAVDVLPDFTRKAVEYIGSHAPAAKGEGGDTTPFFLYLPLTSPHTPILPSAEWRGKSGLSDYGDFVMQTDWAVGEVLAALETAELTENTLVIFTSDNGCSPSANVKQLEEAGHFPSADFRGYKSDIWEGGHRVPFIARWPGQIHPGHRSGSLFCLTDFVATCAHFLHVELPVDAGEDSVSMLTAMKIGKDTTGRTEIIHHSIDGRFAMRREGWKLALCGGSGGWSTPREAAAVRDELPDVQLFNLYDDPGEQHNIAADHPEQVERLTTLLTKRIDDGRTTFGPPQANDVRIRVRKRPKEEKAAIVEDDKN